MSIIKHAISSVAMLSLQASCECADATKSPNFVFVLADDMGWTGTSVQMHEKLSSSRSEYYQTPILDKLAKEGMRFSAAYSPSAMCTPTRASLITGKSPALLHMTTPGPANKIVSDRKVIPPTHIDQFPESEITIAEILKDKGYASAYFGKWHMHGGGPGKHGFDKHDGDTGNKSADDVEKTNPKDIFGMTERANLFMDKHVKAGNPFFVQLSHYALHKPIQYLSETEKYFSKLSTSKYHSDVEYAAMTKDLDTSVGILLDKIQKLGISENTYIIFMSDNGAGSARNSGENYPLAGGKATLMEGGIRVPLIIKGPKIKAGSFCEETVVGFDLYPTLCELASVKKIPNGVEGTSIVPLIHGNENKFKRKNEEIVFHFPHYGKGAKQTPQSAIILGNMKLIIDYETKENKLFNLETDIGETNNLFEKEPEKAKELNEKISSYFEKIKAQLPTENKNYDPSKTTTTNRFIKRFDKNKDNKVSKDEFQGPERRFNKFDKNNDGVISGDEGPQKGR